MEAASLYNLLTPEYLSFPCVFKTTKLYPCSSPLVQFGTVTPTVQLHGVRRYNAEVFLKSQTHLPG